MDIDYFKKKLESEKMLLETELGSIAVKNPRRVGEWDAVAPETDEVDTRDEVAERFEEIDERKSAEVTLEKQLRRVVLALQMIKNGAYGICQVCGQPIEEARLQINPSASTCINHKEQGR